MKIVEYPTLVAAQAAQRALDTARGYPRTHAEGLGPDDYVINFPGAGGADIRAAGVRTEHAYPILVSLDGTKFAIGGADLPGAIEVDASAWHGARPARATP